MAQEQPSPGAAADESAEGGWDVPWTWVDAAMAFLAGILLAELTRQLLAFVVPTELMRALVPGVGSIALLIAILAWLQLRHPGTLPRLRGPGAVTPAKVIGGLGHGLAAFVVLNVGLAALFTLLAGLLGAELPEVQETIREVITDPDVAIAGIIYAVAIATVVEEVFFRGLLFQALRRLGRWPAIGISGLVFGLAHYQPDNPVGWLYTFIVMFAFGMYLAWAFDRYRHLVVPLLMHIVFNAFALVLILRGW